MQKRAKNKMTMFNLTRIVLNEHKEEWESIPGFVKMFNTFNDKLDQLQKSTVNQSTVTIGVKASLEEKKRLTIERTILFAGVLSAHALDIKNTLLLAQVHFRVSHLYKCPRMECMQIINSILHRAEEYASDIQFYGISQTDIEQYRNLCDELDNVLLSPREAILQRKKNTLEIDNLVREMDTHLKLGLDCLMKGFKTSNSEFYERYMNSRKTIHYGTRHNS